MGDSRFDGQSRKKNAEPVIGVAPYTSWMPKVFFVSCGKLGGGRMTFFFTNQFYDASRCFPYTFFASLSGRKFESAPPNNSIDRLLSFDTVQISLPPPFPRIFLLFLLPCFSGFEFLLVCQIFLHCCMASGLSVLFIRRRGGCLVFRNSLSSLITLLFFSLLLYTARFLWIRKGERGYGG